MAYLDIRYNNDLVAQNDEEGKRFYTTPEGYRYPSMTSILGDYNKEALDTWRKNVGENEANNISRIASNKGTKIHALCEQYVLGEEVDKTNPFMYARFQQLKPIIDNRIGAVYAVEAALYSNFLKLAGRTDNIGQFDGLNSIIDWKTSKKPKKKEWISQYFMQEAGYAAMWTERTQKNPELRIQQLVTIISVENSDPQIFVEPVAPWFYKLCDYLQEVYPAFKRGLKE